MNKDKTKNKSSLSQYLSKRILIVSFVSIILYVVIYFCFVTEGFIPAGVGLDKTDWLSFLGAYLSFSGTVLVSLTVFWHTNFVAKYSENRVLLERKKRVQPVFSIKIFTQNSVMDNNSPFIDVRNKPERPSNVIIKIENANEFPITNVIIFDKYITPLLKPSEEISVYCTYSDPTNTYKFYNSIAVINETDYEKDSSGLPMWFNINYDDVEGNSVFQTFKLQYFDDTKYYSLAEISEP